MADWNDIRLKYQAGLAPDDILHTGSPLVSRDGQMFWKNKRHYIATRANRKPESGYLAHDTIDNRLFDLGSWTTAAPVLCFKGSAAS